LAAPHQVEHVIVAMPSVDHSKDGGVDIAKWAAI